LKNFSSGDSMNQIMHWIYVLITAIIPGFLATWLGIGGCFLRIPMIMYFFKVSIKAAYCINQAVIALATIPGVIVHYRNRYVYGKGLIVAAITSCLGVILGAYVVAKYLPRLVLRAIFGFACTGIGIYVLRKTMKMKERLKTITSLKDVGELEHGAKLALLMFIAGFATGICGFGGGIYFVPIFMGLAYPTHVAIGTSSAQMIFTGGMGSAVLTYHGYMNLSLFLSIGIPTLIASWLGAKAARRSPPYLLRIVYALSIIAVGLYVAIDALMKVL